MGITIVTLFGEDGIFEVASLGLGRGCGGVRVMGFCGWLGGGGRELLEDGVVLLGVVVAEEFLLEVAVAQLLVTDSRHQ